MATTAYKYQHLFQEFLDSGDAAIEIDASSEKALRSAVERFNKKFKENVKGIASRGHFYLINPEKIDN